MAQSDSSIKILTSQVQEDGKLKRVIEAYVEEGGRDLICITKFDGQQEFFWLQCPHSLQLSPHYCKEVQKIRKKKAKKITFYCPCREKSKGNHLEGDILTMIYDLLYLNPLLTH